MANTYPSNIKTYPGIVPDNGGGGGGTWTPYPFTGQTTLAITHGLNQIPVNIIIMDNDKNQIMPLYQAQFTDVNNVSIDFGSATSGIAFISP